MNEVNLPEMLESEKHVVIGDAFYFPNMAHDFYHMSRSFFSPSDVSDKANYMHSKRNRESHALRFGTMTHAYIVEGENEFNNTIACISGSPYTNANKQLKKDYESRGLTVISSADRDKIIQMDHALLPEKVRTLKSNEDEFLEHSILHMK